MHFIFLVNPFHGHAHFGECVKPSCPTDWATLPDGKCICLRAACSSHGAASLRRSSHGAASLRRSACVASLRSAEKWYVCVGVFVERRVFFALCVKTRRAVCLPSLERRAVLPQRLHPHPRRRLGRRPRRRPPVRRLVRGPTRRPRLERRRLRPRQVPSRQLQTGRRQMQGNVGRRQLQ